MIYSHEDLTEAKRQIDSTIHKLKETVKTLKSKDNPSRYKSQITLATRRISAFEIANDLIEKELAHQPKQRFREAVTGAILGFVVGDALGVPAEFMERNELTANPVTGMRSGGAHGQPAGTWSDDTSMTLCTMDSLEQADINYDDLMHRFSQWLWDAANTAHNEVFDVGGTTKAAIFKFLKKVPALECGERQDYCCGNGSLMRILPTALYLMGTCGSCTLDDHSAEIIHNTSICTHAHPRCQMACGIYCSVVFHLFCANSLTQGIKEGVDSALEYYQGQPAFADVYQEFESLRQIESWPMEQICSSGYVLHTLQAALWCLLTTKNYKDCVLKAVNLGEDTDTTAAVAGGLAGLWYKEEAIPTDWADTTIQYREIKARCNRFSSSCIRP